MRLQLSPELEAFREEMRTFFTTEVPQEIRDTVAARRHADQGPVRRDPADPERRRPRRAALAGRVGRPGLDAAAAPHLARGDAAGRRPRAARVQHLDDRPGHRRVRQRGAEGAVPGQDGEPRHLVVPGLLRARRRLRPRLAAHHRRPRRRRVRRQRPEDVDDARPVRRLDLLPGAAPTRPPRRSSAASRCWSSRWTPPASRCGRSS